MVSSGGGGTPKQPANPVPNGPTTSFGQSTPFDPSAGFDSVLPGGGWVTPEMMSNSWSSNAQARAAAPPPPAPAAAAGPPQQSPMSQLTAALQGAYGRSGMGMVPGGDKYLPQDTDSKALRNQLAVIQMMNGGGAPSNVGYGGGGGGGRGGNYGSSGGFGGSSRR